MFDEIDPRSPTPLYDQIASRVRVAVASGDFRPGESLPSVRGLATRLRVNPATVVQAYRALEQEGFVEMRQGAGTYVREVAEERRGRERDEQALRMVRDLLADAARFGIGADAIASALRQELRSEAP
ncbi:MAG TPA: GntR family transcriptional regulator [Gemmatimonadales bacterium]